MTDSPVAVILAAGKGTRMRSDLPKVLHRLRQRPLLLHVLDAAGDAGVGEAVVVVGHGAAQVRDAVDEGRPASITVRYALQAQQRGTGHAVQCALPELARARGAVLILSGDVPCITADTLRRLLDACASSSGGLSLATFRPADATGYGRVVRDAAGHPVRIVEHRDADEGQRAIDECNAGVYCVAAERLRAALGRLDDDNAAGEIYLTDIVAQLAARGTVVAVEVDGVEVAGVNTPEQLAELEARV